MNNDFQSLLEAWLAAGAELGTSLTQSLEGLLLPSRLIQLGVAAALIVLAWGLSLWVNARLEAWIRGHEGWKTWQLRWLIVLRRRMALILSVVLLWGAVAVFAGIYTFPSRRYLLVLFATIATAWLAIRLAAQVVRNRALRQVVVWGLSAYATLYYLDLLDETAAIMDAAAVEFGDFRLSLLSVFKAVVVTGLLFYAARLSSGAIARRVRQLEDFSPSVQELTIKAAQVILFGTAFFIGLKAAGFDLTGLAVLSGAIGVGLGFGLQKVVSNLVSGIIILMDKSVKPGDVISIGDTFGWINTLGARYVSVVTRDGKEYLIPNEDLITGQVVNWSHSNDLVRLDLNFGLSYADNPHEVRKVAVAAAAASSRVLRDPAPVCHVVNFGDSSVDYVLRFWIRDPSSGLTNIRGNVYLALWDAFHEHGFTIPFPQREVRVLNDSLTIAARPPSSGADAAPRD